MEKLVLIDGNSLINRAFYAMPLLTTKKGEYTNAVYGFMNMFFKMLDDEKPSAVAVAFDLKAPTFRHKMYSEYKGTRRPMPEELRPQIPLLKNLLKLMGVTVIEKEGFEADDIIGTIAKHTQIQTVIITGDKDSFQLVDHETEVHFTKRGLTDVEIYNHKNFTEKMGINPEQIIDLKSLMGDSSDNIPGVPGVGEKTAKTLIQTYGSVDGVYQHVDELKGKLKEKIEQGKESALLSKTLATIDTNAPVDTDVSKMGITLPLNASVRARFIELEFKSLSRREDLFDTDENFTLPSESAVKEVELVIASDISQLNDITIKDGLSLFVSNEKVSLYDGEKELSFPIRATLLDDGFDLSPVLTALTPILSEKHKLTVYINVL